MNKTNFRMVMISGLLMIALLLISGCSQTATPSAGNVVKQEKAQPIKIGWFSPLTGDVSSYGIELRQVADIAVDEINSNGGINGRPVEMIYEDAACSAKGGATAAQKLIGVDGVKVLLGGLCSGETLGAAPVAENAKVILFSPGSGSPDITKAGDYVFRNFPSDATSGSKVAKAAYSDGDRRIAIISEQTDYSQALKTVFKDTFVKEGGVVLIDETYDATASDFRAQLTKIKYANPDGMYIAAQSSSKLGLILKQMGEIGLKTQIYTNEFAATKDTLESYSKEIEGAIYAEAKFDENSEAYKELNAKIDQRYGGSFGGILPPVYQAMTYDAIYVLKEAMEKCGEDTDCIKDALYAVNDRMGVAGKLSIDENGDAVTEYIVKTIRNGSATPLAE